MSARKIESKFESHHLKCGFLKKSFVMNAPLVSCPFPVIRFGWVQLQQQTHPKWMNGNGQLTRGAFIINDFLRNPHFSTHFISELKSRLLKLTFLA